MKIQIPTTRTVEVTQIRLSLPVRYDEEDIPNDFPMREGNMWNATVEIDSGRIISWPQGNCWHLHMKVCDGGSYTLLDEGHMVVAEIKCDYVPHGIVPGEYGDYVDLQIDATGTITNWPKKPNVDAFFNRD